MNYHHHHRHHLLLFAATLASRIFSFLVLAVANSILPIFDTSPRLINYHSKWTQPLMRWDSLHFKAIADAGYLYENQWAFFPGTPFLLRFLCFGTNDYYAWFFIHLAVATDSTHTLYQLTRHHFPDRPNFAYLVGLLSLLPSSPVTLHFAPYAEPLFTYLSYKGMFYTAKERWVVAALCFTVAATLRSNGIFLSGYLFWGLAIQPFWDHRKVSLIRITCSIILIACVLCPSIYHNYSAYLLFCLTPYPNRTPEWCGYIPPSIYTYVQAKYWNVGFLRYWDPAQAPNFVIAAPPLVLLASFSTLHLVRTFTYHLRASLGLGSPPGTAAIAGSSPFMKPSIIPYLIHTLLMCITLLLFSHTQIVLRLAAALPTLYWGAAWLLLRDVQTTKPNGIKTNRRCWGTLWIWWSTLWGFISLGLWAAFLPPA